MLGQAFRFGVTAALVATLFGGSAWTMAGPWIARADARPTATKVEPKPRVVTQYDREIGQIYYRVPQGYSAVEAENAVIMRLEGEPEIDAQGFLTITPGFDLTPEFRRDIAQDKIRFLEGTAAAYAELFVEDPGIKFTAPVLANAQTAVASGYEAYTMASLSFDPEKQRQVVLSYLIVITSNRAETIFAVGQGPAGTIDKYSAGLNALIGSLGFKEGGAPPPSSRAPPLQAAIVVR